MRRLMAGLGLGCAVVALVDVGMGLLTLVALQVFGPPPPMITERRGTVSGAIVDVTVTMPGPSLGRIFAALGVVFLVTALVLPSPPAPYTPPKRPTPRPRQASA